MLSYTLVTKVVMVILTTVVPYCQLLRNHEAQTGMVFVYLLLLSLLDLVREIRLLNRIKNTSRILLLLLIIIY
jgi:hypothetical protein